MDFVFHEDHLVLSGVQGERGFLSGGGALAEGEASRGYTFILEIIGGALRTTEKGGHRDTPCGQLLITLSSPSLRALISVSFLETSICIMLHERRDHCPTNGLFVKRKVAHFPRPPKIM
jgi:hypothetical protein